MSDIGCGQWRGDLGARALGLTDPDRDPGLDAHLDGCPACRQELEDLRAAVSALALTDVEHLEHSAAAPDLGERIVRRISAQETSERRRRRWRVAAGGALAAAAVVVVVALTVNGEGGDGGREVALAGDGRVEGSAALVGRAWGTEVTLEVNGLDEGQVYWLWLSDRRGERVVAGTLTGTGSKATAVLASALPLDAASRIWMTDEDDRVVLDARIAPG